MSQSTKMLIIGGVGIAVCFIFGLFLLAVNSSKIPAYTGQGIDGGSPARRGTARITDDFTPRLQQHGAQGGDVQISLAWDNINDIDLHCNTPSGAHIYFARKRSRDGGWLDVDMNVSPPLSNEPVENIFWPAGGAPLGQYIVSVDHYNNHGGQDPTAFRVRTVVRGKVTYYKGEITHGERKQEVCRFELTPQQEPTPTGTPK